MEKIIGLMGAMREEMQALYRKLGKSMDLLN